VDDIDWARVGSFVLAVVATWLVTGALKAANRLPCDVARKVNHVLALAGGAAWLGWLPEAKARASICAAAVVLVGLVAVVCAFRRRALVRWAFLANTRRTDAPHEAFYFWSSWVISAGGLVGVHFLFGDVIVTRTAALLVGIGDGIAEPIGRRIGRHKYRVRSLTGTVAVRSLEGSAAVFVGCLAVLLACFGSGTLVAAALLALLLTVVEAVSPHGLDNLTIPVVAAFCLRPMFNLN
jgi:dolichol kinase